ncbi:hypothetical protein P5704_026585 (plasmid) [Pseudomonas sp. FeN3W]|nr:hypothetical protein P5704_026585 [Pseudomonas sp. FeN3W]
MADKQENDPVRILIIGDSDNLHTKAMVGRLKESFGARVVVAEHDCRATGDHRQYMITHSECSRVREISTDLSPKMGKGQRKRNRKNRWR